MSTTSDEVLSQPLIRTLSFSDLPAIMEIERASFSTPWREATFVGLLRRTDTDLIGATRTGRLVGYCVCWTVGDQAELGNIAVAPQERGHGTGTRLVEAGLSHVRRRGASECFLEVRESNANARSIYEKCGFETVGRRRNYYSRPSEDALVMRRELI
jgi:[ribosomal protein S18]-alanine N-acetyltransferase